MSVSTKELQQIKYTCVLLPLSLPRLYEVKKLFRAPPLSQMKVEIAFKKLTSGEAQQEE